MDQLLMMLLMIVFPLFVLSLPLALLALLIYLAFWLMETLHTLLLGLLDGNLRRLCRSQKRRLVTGGIVFLLTAAAFLWLEFGGEYDHLKWEEVPCSEEQIVAEMPDILLTDADLALLDRVLAAPEAASAREKGDYVDFSLEKAMAYTADYPGKPSDACEISVSAWSVWIEFKGDGQKELYLRRLLNAKKTDSVYKTIRLYRPDSDKKTEDILCQYNNDGVVLTKEVLIHDWFQWVNRYTILFTG